MRTNPTTCPALKQVVMLYCDACPQKKMVPLDQLVSESPCLAESYRECSIYRELLARNGMGVTEGELPPETVSDSRREVLR